MSRSDGSVERSEQSGGLVARNRELAHLDHVLWKARAGGGSVVVLRGEPGVGKSSLIEATVARATDFGVVQLRGTSLDQKASLPKEWPAQVVALLEEPSMREPVMLEASSGDLASADKPHGAGGSEGSTPVATISNDLEVAAADAVRSLFDDIRAPTLITVDDCHLLPQWFPAALSKAVAGPLSDMPVALILGWRDTPHMPVIGAADLNLPEHRLLGLNHQQATTLLRQAHGRVPVESVLTALVAATGGNPSAMLDIASRLDPEQLNGWRPLPEPLPISEALAEAFAERLASLSEDIQKALATASAGRFPVSVLEAALIELGLEFEALQPAQQAGVVAVRGDRIDFNHPLVRAAAFMQVPEDFRWEVHAAISKVFSARGNVERSAFHAGQRPRPQDGSVSRLYSQSSRVALDRRDPETAARYEEMASDFAATEDATALHLSRAAALWSSVGQVSRARTCVDRALGRASSVRIDAEVRYQGARARLAGGLSTEVSDDLLVAAKLCEAETPYRAVLMLGDAVACKLLGGCSDDSAEIAERAVYIARAVSSHAEALSRAALGAAHVLEGAPSLGSASDDDSPDLRADTSLLIGQIQQFGASPQLAYVIGRALMQQGHIEQALRWARWIEDCSETVGDRSLSVVPPLLRASATLLRGRLTDAVKDAGAAVELAERSGQQTLRACALGELTEAHAAQGSYESGFESAAQLFGLSGEMGRAPRVQALTALAHLELQRNRPSAALAWLGAADDDAVPRVGLQAANQSHDSVRANWANASAEVLLLARRRSEAAALLPVVEQARAADAIHRAWLPWIAAICTDDLDDASEQFESAREDLDGMPLLSARLELCWGTRLAEGNRYEEARERLCDALYRFEDLNAQGWVELADREINLLPPEATPDGVSPGGPEVDIDDPELAKSAAEARGEAPQMANEAFHTATPSVKVTEPPWEVTLLGSFAVHRFGEPVSLPLSLAAQGLKIVALHGRIPVDELVELLWPEAGPGVGTRRLRNVLWRVRAASGDLLERDDNFICLAPDAVTDVAAFRRLAERALDRELPAEEATALAREALVLYRGELLPGDRYADWATGFRESMSRLHILLLELLLNSALGQQHLQEAAALLERLIEADPYEEQNYLRASELQGRFGNRRRALSLLDRAERVLTDLGVSPSRALLELRRSLITQ